MRTLVIDDLRNPIPERFTNTELVIARNSEEGLHLLEEFKNSGGVTELYLDHDLGGDDTIRPVVSWLEESAYFGDPYPVERVFIHTSNSVGGDWVKAALQRFYTVERVFAGVHFTQ